MRSDTVWARPASVSPLPGKAVPAFVAAALPDGERIVSMLRTLARVTGLWVVIALSVAGVQPAAAQDIKPHGGMLRYPAVSRTHIAFCYAERLWLVPREGGVATPLAAPPGGAMLPRFRADGKAVAFLAGYEGGRDIYTIPIEGGVPFRVTHHPAGELLSAWLPDGRLLFSARIEGLGNQSQLYTVSEKGGLPVRLPVPYGALADISEDGRWLAYTPHTVDFATWKRYQGGMQTDIWLFDLETRKSKRMTDWPGVDTAPMWQGKSVWYVSTAGPEHRSNIWVYDTVTGKRRQVTKYADFDVKWPSRGPGADGKGEIVFQHGSELCLMDLATEKVRVVDVRIPGERITLAPRDVDVSRFIFGWGISATGKRAVIEARGDIWTAPVKNGVPRNLTRSDGSNERDPAWSPDGRWIAYLSDATGEYELYITQSDGRGETRQLTKDGGLFRYQPVWSPDSKRIAFTDQRGSLLVHTIETGQTVVVDTDPWAERPDFAWSPDSKWCVYTRHDERPSLTSLWLYSLETGAKQRLTSGMFADSSPVFDRKGEYLYWVSQRNFSPTYEQFGTTWVYTDSQVLMAAALKADTPSPYLPKVEDETWQEPARSREQTGQTTTVALGPVQSVSQQAQDPVTGQWSGTVTGEGLPTGPMNVTAELKLEAGNRVTGRMDTPLGGAGVSGAWDPANSELKLSAMLPIGVEVSITLRIAGDMATGTAEVQGQTLQVRLRRQTPAQASSASASPSAPAGGKQADAARTPPTVQIDVEGFEARAIQLAPRPGTFGRLAVNDKNQLIFVRQPARGSAEGQAIKLFDIRDEKKEEKTVAAGAGAFDISADGKKLLVIRGNAASIQDASPGASSEMVITSGMTARIDPRREWRQIYNEAWRTMRQFFYAPNMHGVDWEKMREHYAAMLDDCASREDVSYVIGELIGELNVGHAYYFGGDVSQARSASVGMLGADFELKDGAYRIARIYRGAPWDADARGPLGEAGVKVKEGDFLLAVNGVPVDTTRDPWAAFQGLADKAVTITVSDKPTLDETARDVTVQLASSESYLRYRAWVERNRAYVDRETGGRVGYVYVPNTGVDGQNELMRQLVSQRGKDALIIDERWNGGGQVPHRFVELLNRPLTNYWVGRYGPATPWPPDAHMGPKCMLINGLAGSGGDLFPWYFRDAGLGKLIGTRTWGGVVGIGGFPRLIDGAAVTTPNFAFFRKDRKWDIEGRGVEPDIEVVDDPALMQNDVDPQLDAAIRLMMDAIKKTPYEPVLPPPYPDRSGMGPGKL